MHSNSTIKKEEMVDHDSCCGIEETTAAPKTYAVTSSSLIQMAENFDPNIFTVRPERTSISFPYQEGETFVGCYFHMTMDAIRIIKINPQGLIASCKSGNNEIDSYNSVLEVGDKLISINGISKMKERIKDRDETDVIALADLVDGMEHDGFLTLVFDTRKDELSEKKKQIGLCKAVIIKSSQFLLSPQRGIRFRRVRKKGGEEGHLKIAAVTANEINNSVLRPNQLVLAIGQCPTLMFFPTDAETLVENSNIVHLTLLDPSSRWDGVKKAVVGVSGGIMVGTGSILFVTPLHPIGHAMAFGGVALLGTQFEGPRLATESMKKRLSSISMISPSKEVVALENELKEALLQHKMLISDKGNTTKDDEKEALENIRRVRYQLGQWQDTLLVEEELHERYYETPLELAKSHHRLGCLFQQLEQYSKSKEQFSSSLSIFEKKVYPSMFHADMGEAWNSLAGLVVVNESKLELAMKYLKEAEPHFRYHEQRKNRENTYNTKMPHPELRKCLENEVKLLSATNRHEEANLIRREIEEIACW